MKTGGVSYRNLTRGRSALRNIDYSVDLSNLRILCSLPISPSWERQQKDLEVEKLRHLPALVVPTKHPDTVREVQLEGEQQENDLAMPTPACSSPCLTLSPSLRDEVQTTDGAIPQLLGLPAPHG